MKAETSKLTHLGIDYFVRRSTLAEANKRLPSDFFAQIYVHLLEQYGPFLAGSRAKGDEKDREKLLYIIDSTTISLFDNILKGVGRHPKKWKEERWHEGSYPFEIPNRRSHGRSAHVSSQT